MPEINVLNDPNYDPQVAANQSRLQQLGLYTGAIDGLPGPVFNKAVLAFQQKQGLKQDGILGKQTQSMLTTLAEPGSASEAEQALAGASQPATEEVQPGSFDETANVVAPQFGKESVAKSKTLTPRGQKVKDFLFPEGEFLGIGGKGPEKFGKPQETGEKKEDAILAPRGQAIKEFFTGRGGKDVPIAETREAAEADFLNSRIDEEGNVVPITEEFTKDFFRAAPPPFVGPQPPVGPNYGVEDFAGKAPGPFEHPEDTIGPQSATAPEPIQNFLNANKPKIGFGEKLFNTPQGRTFLAHMGTAFGGGPESVGGRLGKAVIEREQSGVQGKYIQAILSGKNPEDVIGASVLTPDQKVQARATALSSEESIARVEEIRAEVTRKDLTVSDELSYKPGTALLTAAATGDTKEFTKQAKIYDDIYRAALEETEAELGPTFKLETKGKTRDTLVAKMQEKVLSNEGLSGASGLAFAKIHIPTYREASEIPTDKIPPEGFNFFMEGVNTVFNVKIGEDADGNPTTIALPVKTYE